MKPLYILLILLVSSISAWADYEYNTNKNGVVLNGYDVVSYFQKSKPIQGVATFKVVHNKVTFWFANQENKNAFLKNPEKYEPAFGGWCAYAVADSGSKVEVDPESFIIQNNRLLVFYDGFLGDTRKKWTKDNNAQADQFLKKADSIWPNLISKEP